MNGEIGISLHLTIVSELKCVEEFKRCIQSACLIQSVTIDDLTNAYWFSLTGWAG